MLYHTAMPLDERIQIVSFGSSKDKEGFVNTYIALFRGINVGIKNRISMQELMGVFQSIGCENVQTYIQSGNVVFTSDEKVVEKIKARIKAGIIEKMGFDPTILILSPKQLQDAVFHNPFPTNEGKALHFFFFESPVNKASAKSLQALRNPTEECKLGEKVLYLYAPDGIGRSRLASAVEKKLEVLVTGRNWNTVSKLAAMTKKA
jgi:uncharacterized protein (DUF1697 family)